MLHQVRTALVEVRGERAGPGRETDLFAGIEQGSTGIEQRSTGTEQGRADA
ncbi:hypothetical protein ACFVRU_31755 [Streptomyces sp. NPDC057927]